MKEVLPAIISSNQSGFLKGRNISDSIRTVYDIMHYLEETNEPGILYGIDFEKAFDSISISFIRKVLNLFKFGPSIIKWFNTFYADNYSSVLVNGFLSEKIPIERGCRQGDPVLLTMKLFMVLISVVNAIN